MSGETNGSSESYVVPLWINGKEETTKETFDVVSPASHKTIWTASSATPEDAIRACDAAEKAFKSWRKTKPAAMRTILLKAADEMERRAKELGDYMREETGALDNFAGGFNVPLTVENIRDVAGRISSINGVIPSTATEGTGAFVFKEPYGVILGIAPWNAPYILGVRSMLFALATGNTVILKGSELSPRVFWAIGDVFHKAGVPDGVLNVLYHKPADAAAVTNAIIEHNAVKKINFTGSTMVGSILSAKAGKELKPVLMELGGKASAIVCEDADIGKAAFQSALGAFLHAGQICMSTERIIVNRKVLEPFTEALKDAVKKIYPEHADAPVLVSKATVEKNEKLFKDAESKGATVIHGDTSDKHESPYRLRPTIVANVKRGMDIYYTESFGPSVSLIAVDSDEEAIELANDTDYGLSGAVFTSNLSRGLKMAKQIDSGAIHINSMSVHDEAMLPHGGVKKSGWGRFNAQWGLEEFLKLKTVTYEE